MSDFAAIVIGGGMAGISACLQLINSGVLNIILLEASNRLGGRIHTVQLGKTLSLCSLLNRLKKFYLI